MEKVWKVVACSTGRHAKWAVLTLWLVAAVAVTPLAILLTDAQKNDASSFLPPEAESTRLLEAQKALPGGDAVPAIIVFARDPVVTAADRATTERLVSKLGEYSTRPVGPPIPSPDGRVLILSLGLAQNSDVVRFTDDVKEIRRIVRDAAPPGLQTAVTGPAGLLTDSYDVFAGVNTTLLFVTGGVVAFILLVVYRSPVLWLVPLLSVAVADQAAAALIYLAAEYGGLSVNGQSAGILRVLVFGAGTDYALLLIARYREELTRRPDVHDAMRVAIRRSGPAIAASAFTVIISMLCLLLGELNSDRGLGPVGAIGIAVALITMMTLLPAALLICGRWLFWPFIPRYGSTALEESGFWSRAGTAIAKRPRRIWIGTVLVLAGLGLATLHLDTTLRQDDAFSEPVESVIGARLAQQSFPPGVTAPTYVIARSAAADDVLSTVKQNPSVALAVETGRASDLVQFLVVISDPPDTATSFNTIRQLRDAVHAIPAADALVGGSTAVNLDVREAAIRDRQLIIPVVLVVVVAILGLLLRAIVTPLILIATVVLSFFAALGASALAYDWLFGFAGADPSLPLIGFIFLVALGIDYNIFLMTRVREETQKLGSRPGVLRGLAVTGGVITSAGIVLAATFAVLFILPLVQLAEVGFLVAFGVLLDTLIVRSILVPALALDLGPRIWWPSRLAGLRPAPSPLMTGTDGSTGPHGHGTGAIRTSETPVQRSGARG